MGVWLDVNVNPLGRRVGDCAVRAIAVALDTDWETAYCLLASCGYDSKNIMNADAVIGKTLRDHGFKREVIPNSCPDCYSAEEFCEDHPTGTYVLFFGGHVACVKNGKLYDTWNSSYEIPQYYWEKE